MIKIKTEETEHGHKYIKFFEVRAIDHEAKTTTLERFLKEEEADEYVQFVEKYHKNLYIKAWTREQLIWC